MTDNINTFRQVMEPAATSFDVRDLFHSASEASRITDDFIVSQIVPGGYGTLAWITAIFDSIHSVGKLFVEGSVSLVKLNTDEAYAALTAHGTDTLNSLKLVALLPFVVAASFFAPAETFGNLDFPINRPTTNTQLQQQVTQLTEEVQNLRNTPPPPQITTPLTNQTPAPNTELDDQIVLLNEQITDKDNQIETLQQQLNSALDNQNQPQSNQIDVNQLTNAISNVQVSNSPNLNQLQEQINTLNNQKIQIEQDRDFAISQKNDMQTERNTAQNENQQLTNQINTLNNEITVLKSQDPWKARGVKLIEKMDNVGLTQKAHVIPFLLNEGSDMSNAWNTLKIQLKNFVDEDVFTNIESELPITTN